MAEAAVVDIDSIESGDAVADQVSPVVGTHVGLGAIGLAFCGRNS